MPIRIRRPWWAVLFATLLICLIGLCDDVQANDNLDSKAEAYVQVEGGATVWLNPGEQYVPGSLRTVHRATPNRTVYRQRYRQPYAPVYLPTPVPAYPTSPYPTPVYPPPPSYPQPRFNPYGYYDHGPYGRTCQGCGVKVDGALRSPYRNWTERRGAMLGDGPDPLSEKKQIQLE